MQRPQHIKFQEVRGLEARADTQGGAWEGETEAPGRANRARVSYGVGVDISSGNRCHIQKVTSGSLWRVGLKLHRQ